MTNSRFALVFAGIAVVTGTAVFLAQLFGFGSPAVLGLAPIAVGLSLSLVFLSVRTRAVVIPLFLVGMAAATLTVVSWSVGFDEADAGVPRSLLGNLFIPAAIAAMVLLGASVGIAFASTLRMRPVGRVLIGVATGLLSVPFVIPPLISPTTSVVVAVALMLVLGLRGPAASAPAKPRASAGGRVRPLAMVALAMTLVSLGYGLVAGIALAGTDAATQAMAVMAGGGNLAAVPLMAAFTQRFAPGRLGPRVGLVVGGSGVAISSIAWAAGMDISGGLFLALPAFFGVWAATMAGALLPQRGTALVGLSVAVGIGSAIAYLWFAVATAGAVLAVASGILAFGRRGPSKTKEIGPELAG